VSGGNVEIVQRIAEAYGQGDLRATLDLLSEESTFRPSGLFMDTQPVYVGHDGWIEFWERFRAAWDTIEIRTERIEDLGERVLVLGVFHGVGGESGVAVDRESGWLVSVRDGLVVEIDAFGTWASALEAAGVSDSPTSA
jgi:ketosteroid isomerase-like protein